MSDTQVSLYPDGHYHIYNHAVGKENLFEIEKDYFFFLSSFRKYVVPIADLFAYCLLPNHFHLVVRVKSEQEIKNYLQSLSKRPIDFIEMEKKNKDFLNPKISQLFSNFFNAYAKHYNFWKKRNGTLFKRAFRRKELTDMQYLQRLIWKYSSYNEIISSNPTLVLREEVIALFGDVENFIYCNSKPTEI